MNKTERKWMLKQIKTLKIGSNRIDYAILKEMEYVLKTEEIRMRSKGRRDI